MPTQPVSSEVQQVAPQEVFGADYYQDYAKKVLEDRAEGRPPYDAV